MWSRASFIGKKDAKGGRWTGVPADPDTVLVRTSHDAVSISDRFAKNKVCPATRPTALLDGVVLVPPQ
jgi:hypothetical protein